MVQIFGGQGCPGANRKGGPTNRDVEQAANDCGIAGFLANCLPSTDPAGFNPHIGKHHSVQESLMAHHEFKAVLKGVKDHVQQAADGGKTTTAIAFWCRSGKHRSVAVDDIVEHILVELGWSVHRVDYMSWYWGVTKCHMCPICRGERAPQGEAVLNYACEIYHSR